MKLRQIREQQKKTQTEVAKFLGVSRQAYNNYELGHREPNKEMLAKLADYFNVSIDYLFGRETIPNHKKKGVKIPVLGRVQAGIPVEAIEEIVDYEEITEEMASQGEYFALIIRGESMLPRMVEGDVIIVRKQPDVNNGDVAVVLVNGNDATVKKIRKSENGIELIPFNPSFEIMYYSNEDIERLPVVILGKVVELRGKF